MNSEGRERWLLTPTSAIASRTAAAPIAVHARKSMRAWSSPKVRRTERVKASAAFAVRDVGIDSLRGEEVKTPTLPQTAREGWGTPPSLVHIVTARGFRLVAAIQL
jgi:hypothetical protein